jgi:hypothetical protein
VPAAPPAVENSKTELSRNDGSLDIGSLKGDNPDE